MSIKNKNLSICFKLFIFLSALAGITIQSGLLNLKFNAGIFNYYTLISNVFCMIYFLFAAIHLKKTGKTLFPVLKGALVMGITVTGLVYHFLLSKTLFSMGGTFALSNMLLHYVVPLFSILDWLLFDEKGKYKKNSPFLWVIIPDLYFVYTIIGVELGMDFSLGYPGRYPYFFIDIDTLGWGSVLINVVVLNIFFVLLGYVFVFIDNKMSLKK